MKFPRRTAVAVLVLSLGASLAACNDDASRERTAVEGTWVLTEFDGLDLNADPNVETTITLEGGNVTGNGGVNTLKGTYDAPEDGKISFGDLAVTTVDGSEAAMEQEERFLSELAKVENFEYDSEGSELELKDGQDDTLLVLRAR